MINEFYKINQKTYVIVERLPWIKRGNRPYCLTIETKKGRFSTSTRHETKKEVTTILKNLGAVKVSEQELLSGD